MSSIRTYIGKGNSSMLTLLDFQIFEKSYFSALNHQMPHEGGIFTFRSWCGIVEAISKYLLQLHSILDPLSLFTNPFPFEIKGLLFLINN